SSRERRWSLSASSGRFEWRTAGRSRRRPSCPVGGSLHPRFSLVRTGKVAVTRYALVDPHATRTVDVNGWSTCPPLDAVHLDWRAWILEAEHNRAQSRVGPSCPSRSSG